MIISLACTYNKYEVSFWFSLVSSIILGTGSALGESTTLGFCKGFPSSTVGFFGSGTGFAGIFGSGSILALKAAGLNNGQIFFIITPTIIPYFLAFWWISRMKAKHPYNHHEDSNSSDITSDDDARTEDRQLVDEHVNGTSSVVT